ncbi:MAG: hypothetical protein H0U12_06740 [Thermoleophilaceae bacterium]|nr:hypothetical protein [Thermoleophilaceae bacterium]
MGIVVLAALLFWTRLVGLDESLWWDEIYAVVTAINVGPSGIWFGTYQPNNHVLFNLLTWATAVMLGPSEPVYRVWSVLPALGAAALLTAWAWRRLGRLTAVFVLFLVTTAPIYVDLTRQARGYGLMALAAVGLLVTADRLIAAGSKDDAGLARPIGGERAQRRRWVAYGAAGMLGLYTHVGFVFGFLTQTLVLLLRRSLLRAAIVTVVAAGILCLAFYAPLLGQMASNLSYNYGGKPRTEDKKQAHAPGPGQGNKEARPPLEWHSTVTGAASLAAPVVEVVARGKYDESCTVRCYSGKRLLLVLPVLLAAGIGGWSLWRFGRRWLLALLAIPPTATFFVLTVPQGFVANRFVSFTLVHILVLMAIGLSAALAWAWSFQRARPVVAPLGLLLALFALFQFTVAAMRWIKIPKEDMKRAAAIVEQSGARPIVTNSKYLLGWRYYLKPEDVTRLAPARLESMFCNENGGFGFIDHPLMTQMVNTSCLAGRGTRIRVPQRSRGKHIDVWLVPPRSPGAAAARN